MNKPKKTNPSTWHPYTSLNQEMYFSNEVDMYFKYLENKLKASEWVRKDNALRTYDGLTEENSRLKKEVDRITNLRIQDINTINRYIEALEFYAKLDRTLTYEELIEDSGNIARKAMENK